MLPISCPLDSRSAISPKVAAAARRLIIGALMQGAVPTTVQLLSFIEIGPGRVGRPALRASFFAFITSGLSRYPRGFSAQITISRELASGACGEHSGVLMA